MHRIELAQRVTPDSAQALWYELESSFDRAGPRSVTVDASGVRHLSAAALQVLMVAHKRAMRDGGSLIVLAPSAQFLDCIMVMGAEDLVAEDAA